MTTLGQNDAVHFRVERATGPFCRATSPIHWGKESSALGEPPSPSRPGGRFPPETARLAVPPKPITWFRSRLWRACLLLLTLLTLLPKPCHAAQAELKNLSIDGGIQDGKARLIIEAQLAGLTGDKDRLLYATALQHTLQISREKHTHTIQAAFDILQGEPKELALTITGEGEIRKVTGGSLQDWSVRQETNGTRSLVLRPRKTEKPPEQFTVTIVAERELRAWANPVRPLALAPPHPALFQGYLKIETAPELAALPTNSIGLVPIEARLLPEAMRTAAKSEDAEPLAFRFHGSTYALPLIVTFADPEARRVVLRDFQLDGQLGDRAAAFTLSATARVKNPRGGSLALLSGGVALAELEQSPDWRLKFESGQFVLVFDRAGEFPVRLKFNASVRQDAAWSSVDFRVAPAALQPVTLRGLAADTQFQFTGAARPERAGDGFQSFLPPDGVVKLAWKETKREEEGKLFYAVEMLSQISIGSGMMRQTALLEGRVMQGELNRVTLLARGRGSVTAVQGANVLAWNVEPGADASERRLVVRFNQPQKDVFTLQVQMQTELGALPQAVDAMQLRPEGATRFAGHLRVVNEGAVRLEVVQAAGLSQISPEQFPESDATRALLAAPGNQRFAFRFSSADFALRVNADNVLPEVSVSQLLAYHLGETELAIDAEFELDIREAPLREVLLRVPGGYALSGLGAPGLSDYFLTEPEGQADAELRLVYGAPVSGRQVIQLRLERNAALGQPAWTLPRLEVAKAKSTRGHIAVSADAGFRLTPDRTAALTDIATAFFPRKVAGIQAAFRLSEPAWGAVMRVERLPQSVQADVFHLFSIGEGIAYGSSTITYSIAGAPVSQFLVSLSDEYFNVEFTGKDLRGNWQKTPNGYLVALNTPVSGAYTLLATYERPFKAGGDTLAFTGARPLDAQSEQGHTLVVSAYQFQVKPTDVSPGLLPLETAEVPAEYRLFFDAPVLAAYRYTARPFNLQLALQPLAQGETVSLVVDRAVLRTRISKDGEVLTDARYFVKNRGNPHLRLTLPEGLTLWSATVNGATAVPVKDRGANLIPLPQRADPNAVQQLDLKLASRSKSRLRVTAQAPIVAAPVLLAEWRLEPDAAQRLVYREGSLAPKEGVADVSGFAGLARMLREEGIVMRFAWMLALIVFAVGAWRWATRAGTHRFSVRHVGGSLVGLAAALLAGLIFLTLTESASRQTQSLPRALSFLAPVQQSDSALRVEVANVPDALTFGGGAAQGWPALLALAVWACTFLRLRAGLRPAGLALGWTLLAWTALRWPNGAGMFLLLAMAFVIAQVLWPAARELFRVPRGPDSAAKGRAATATASLLVGGLSWVGFAGVVNAEQVEPRVVLLAQAAPARTPPAQSAPKAELAAPAIQAAPSGSPAARMSEPALAGFVVQDIRVEGKFAIATARIRWHAMKGQMLPVLFDPAVLTRMSHPTNFLSLVQTVAGGRRAHQLLAHADGPFDIEAQYQLHVIERQGETGFELPTQHGLVNRATLTLPDLDVDVLCPAAVSVQRDTGATNATVATLVLAPVERPWIAWKPRSRDVKREKAVFYVETFQLYAPVAGVVEGVHQIQVRPAQGELSELIFDVPERATITDVFDGGSAGRSTNAPPANPQSAVSLWRFDPDTRKLRVTLGPAQSRPFTLFVRSQITTGPLPFELRAGLLGVMGAAAHLASVGIATGPEVQLDDVAAGSFSPINLEDFPAAALQPLRAPIPGLTLRRAFRATDAKAALTMKAAAVEPDVRVDTQETLSLGEDRMVLAVNATATITRAGIFRVSFALPAGLDVESVSGEAISHWTELKSGEDRVITLHLKGRTEGQHAFSVTLTGPGLKGVKRLDAPRVAFREAGKQRGQMVIVPEQGMRLQVAAREGVTQLDPQKAGIRQKGVLLFRLLQADWSLALDLEQVDAWVQVTSLQHVSVSEAQTKAAANLQYQIENTGLKALRVLVPADAESVRFRGEQVADFLPVPGAVTNGLQTWEIKLHRRIIGRYLLQAVWQTPLPTGATNALVRGVQALDANLQRGFVTVQSGGRLQARLGAPPAALQPAEWQGIPRALLQDIPAATANHTFRLVEPDFQLALRLERHDPAQLLPARVAGATLTSVISDEGVMLTQVKLDLVPGDKRLLHFTLPPDARFWFAFVNRKGVWPWREADRILVPLEQQSRADQPATVELFYSSRIGSPGGGRLDLALHGPKFDLPLENITWQVHLDEKWRLADWTGTLQLQGDTRVAQPAAVDVQSYLQNEAIATREKTRAAEEMLSLGNTLLERGDPQQARRAFQSAFGLSAHDQAFNEDARVQLHNLKLQQALLGLNYRQSVAGGEPAAAPGNLRDLRNRTDVTYTQQEAKQVMDANTADDNAALMRLAERIVQQQDAAVPVPTAISASIPRQGRVLTFGRTVLVDPWADLSLGLEIRSVRDASAGMRAAMLGGVFAGFVFLAWLAGRMAARRERA